MESIKKVVRVTVEKDIEIELTPELFGEISLEEYLEEFSSSLWEAYLNEVFKYAARCAFTGGGYSEDGLGLIARKSLCYPRAPGVIFTVIEDSSEEEIISDENK